MSSDTDMARVSARLPDELNDELDQLVEDGIVHSKSTVIRRGTRKEVYRLQGRDVDDGVVDGETLLRRIERKVDDLPADLKRTIRGEFSRVDSRDTSGRGRR